VLVSPVVNMRHLTVSAALIAFGAILSSGARAEDKPTNAKIEEMRKRLEEARKLMLKKQQELLGKAGASSGGAGGKKADAAKGGSGGSGGKKTEVAKGGSGGSGGKSVVASPKAAEVLAELDKTRVERRKATVLRIRERWGALIDTEAARSELRQHAERVARLSRIRSLAEEKKKLTLLEAVDVLFTKEELRHGNAMNALRTGGKP
jgi:hypothetical protein